MYSLIAHGQELREFLFYFMKDQMSSVFKNFWSNQTFHLIFLIVICVQKVEEERH